jgi:hypothetical protein
MTTDTRPASEAAQLPDEEPNLRKSPTEDVREVEILGARVGIETVQAYGLEFTIDANGNAAVVRFPYGAAVTA